MILYGLWQKYFLPEIKEELDGHLFEATAFYLDQGETETIARKKAEADFGNREEIVKQILQENSHHYYYFLAASFFILCGLLLLIGFIATFSERLINAFILKFFYFWLILLLLFLGYYFIKLIFLKTRQGNTRAIISAFSFIYLFNLAIVIFYDIDGIEIVMQNTFLLAPLLLIILFLKKYLHLYTTKIMQIIFLIITLITISQKSILGWAGTMRCLYVTPDNVPLSDALASCQQIHLWNNGLIPFWLIIIITIIYFFYFVINYLRNKEYIKRKIFIGLTAFAMVIIPIFFYDSNNFHKIEMLNWQPQIITAYRDILGRDPEQKDLDYYSQTKAYLNLERIKTTLYNSSERRIKISLLYQKILKKEPTEFVIDYYVQNKMTIKEIKKDLKAMK